MHQVAERGPLQDTLEADWAIKVTWLHPSNFGEFWWFLSLSLLACKYIFELPQSDIRHCGNLLQRPNWEFNLFSSLSDFADPTCLSTFLSRCDGDDKRIIISYKNTSSLAVVGATVAGIGYSSWIMMIFCTVFGALPRDAGGWAKEPICGRYSRGPFTTGSDADLHNHDNTMNIIIIIIIGIISI